MSIRPGRALLLGCAVGRYCGSCTAIHCAREIATLYRAANIAIGHDCTSDRYISVSRTSGKDLILP